MMIFGKNRRLLLDAKGFSLIEILLLIVVIGIAASTALQWMTASIDDIRTVNTEREMEMLAEAITGDPVQLSNGKRSDFGYIGDIGAFPSNLQALYENPGGYATWDGPYIAKGFAQDSTGFKFDEWGVAYNYGGGITISSTGGGTTLSKKIADASNDYLLNNFVGVIRDSAGNVPGTTYLDSVNVVVTIPNGSGSAILKTYNPDSAGTFMLDSLPVGFHSLSIIYTPNVDTIYRELAILPRNKSGRTYKFATDYFGSGPSTDTSHMIISTGGSALLGGLSFGDDDLADYNSISGTATLFMDGGTVFSGNENIDAVHILANGHIVLSTTQGATIGGLSFENEDLVDYNPISGTALLLFDGSTVFSSNENIDAAYVTDSGSILLSTTGSASIGGLAFQDEDIIEYIPTTGAATMYFDGSSAFSTGADVNGIFIRSNGNFIISIDQDSRQLGGLTFNTEDLAEFDPVSGLATMYFDGATPFGTGNETIDAVHIGDGCGAVATFSCGLVGHWMLDESNGTTASDASTFGNDGSLNNMNPGQDWVAGTINGALDFDGNNDYVQIPHMARLNGSTTLTYAAWVYPHNWSGTRQIMAKSVHGGGSGRSQIGLFSEGGMLCGRAETAGGRKDISTSLTALNDWNHVALVFDSVSLKLFVNGAIADSMVFSSTTLVQTTDPLNISKRVGTSQYYFDGLIDDVRVYDCALDVSEIQTLYNMGN